MPNLRELSICSFNLHTVGSVAVCLYQRGDEIINNLWSFNASPEFLSNNMIHEEVLYFPKQS